MDKGLTLEQCRRWAKETGCCFVHKEPGIANLHGR
jgi:hypothetical protein